MGHLLLLAGLYVLLYAGGLHAQVRYHRLAARGDTALPAPRVLASPAEPRGSTEEALTFSVPVLNTEGRVSGSVPAAEPPAAASTMSRVVIPAIGVDAKTIEVGWEVQQQNGQQVAVWQVAEYAVGHHKGSANPGEGSNIVLAGHVGGYGKVFLDLFYAAPGDEVLLYSQGQQYRYIVQERLLVDEEGAAPEQRAANARYIEPTGHEVLTLVTCWPPTGAERFRQRVIVRALPAGPQPAEAAPHSWTLR
jgi:LPXTG-site transpeptidase (sortase) family protein